MKIPVNNNGGRLPFLLKIYLYICVAVSRLGIAFVNLARAVLRWLLKIQAKLINLQALVGTTIFLITCFAVFSVVTLHGVHSEDKKANDAYETINEYEFLNKPLPSSFFENIELQCNSETTKIKPDNKGKVYSTKISLKNKGEFPILLRRGGKYSFHIRPRLWNTDVTEVVRDGVPIYLEVGGITLVPAGSTYKTRLKFDRASIGSIPDTSKYLIFGVVQEGVRWAPTMQCKFEIDHAKK